MGRQLSERQIMQVKFSMDGHQTVLSSLK